MISHELQNAPTKQKLGCLFKSVFRLTGNRTQNVYFWSFLVMMLRWFPSRGTSNTEKFPHRNVTTIYHDDVIKWKHFPRYWPFVRGIHRSRFLAAGSNIDGIMCAIETMAVVLYQTKYEKIVILKFTAHNSSQGTHNHVRKRLLSQCNQPKIMPDLSY